MEVALFSLTASFTLLFIHPLPVLEEAIANLREAAQRIRATQNLMHARGCRRRPTLYPSPLSALRTAAPGVS
jgi:hypothetical protein